MNNADPAAVRHSRKIAVIVVLISLAPLYAFLGLLGYWWLLDNDPVMVVTGHLPIYNSWTQEETDTYRPGDNVVVTWKYVRLRDCATHYDRTLENTSTTLLNNKFRRTAKVGPGFAPSIVHIPLGLAPGNYRYQVTATFVCNVFQRYWPLRYEFPPIPLKIVIDESYLLQQHRLFEQQEANQ